MSATDKDATWDELSYLGDRNRSEEAAGKTRARLADVGLVAGAPRLSQQHREVVNWRHRWTYRRVDIPTTGLCHCDAAKRRLLYAKRLAEGHEEIQAGKSKYQCQGREERAQELLLESRCGEIDGR